MISPFEAGQVRRLTVERLFPTEHRATVTMCDARTNSSYSQTSIPPLSIRRTSILIRSLRSRGNHCIIPPNSFALASTVEYFRIPRNVLTVCVGKSTLFTPGADHRQRDLFEPEWEGHVTLGVFQHDPAAGKDLRQRGNSTSPVFESDEVCQTSYKDRAGKYQGQTGVTLPKLSDKQNARRRSCAIELSNVLRITALCAGIQILHAIHCQLAVFNLVVVDDEDGGFTVRLRACSKHMFRCCISVTFMIVLC